MSEKQFIFFTTNIQISEWELKIKKQNDDKKSHRTNEIIDIQFAYGIFILNCVLIHRHNCFVQYSWHISQRFIYWRKNRNCCIYKTNFFPFYSLLMLIGFFLNEIGRCRSEVLRSQFHQKTSRLLIAGFVHN